MGTIPAAIKGQTDGKLYTVKTKEADEGILSMGGRPFRRAHCFSHQPLLLRPPWLSEMTGFDWVNKMTRIIDFGDQKRWERISKKTPLKFKHTAATGNTTTSLLKAEKEKNWERGELKCYCAKVVKTEEWRKSCAGNTRLDQDSKPKNRNGAVKKRGDWPKQLLMLKKSEVGGRGGRSSVGWLRLNSGHLS